MSWQEMQLGEFLKLKRGYDLPHSQRQNGDIPVVSSSGITGHHSVAMVEGPGVVTGRYGTLGEVFFVQEDFWPLNTALYVQDFKGNDPCFSAYFLKSILAGVSSDKAAVPGINRNDLHARKITVTSDTIQQKAIATVLSAYDDLIKNNRRRIQLMEQAARLLYKEWFVHLRFPGHEHTQIIDGVPEGWEKGVVSDFYDTASGGTPSRKNPEFYGGAIKWVKTQELQDGFLFDTEEHITEDAIKKSSAKLFPANTVLIAMYGATIGQVGVIVDPSTCNQACCAVMPKAEGTSYEHAFLFFLSKKDGLRNLGQGAAQKNISQQVIRGYEMIFPDKLTLKLFRDYAETFLGQIRILQAMNRQLAKARDLLLPKLMNGEVAV